MERAHLDSVELTGKTAAILSVVEVGLGSVLHSIRVPFSGQFLSLNEAFWLARATKLSRSIPSTHFVPAASANVAAILKSLSPAGKKLTPMLAISVQGLLFNIGTLFFGKNIIGTTVGAALLSAWAFVQPVLLYFIFYGAVLGEMLARLIKEIEKFASVSPENLWVVALTVLTLKALLAVGVAVLAWVLPQSMVDRYMESMRRASRLSPRQTRDALVQKEWRENVRLAWRDLMNPLFLFSLVVTGLFFGFLESDHTKVVWIILRPIAVGFLIFLTVRMIPIERWMNTGLEHKPTGFTRSLLIALRAVRDR